MRIAVQDPTTLTEEEKKTIAARCFELAIAGETYEYEIMYPNFREAALADQDAEAVTEFQEQENESAEHAAMFRKAARNFGLLVPVEHHHSDQYQEAFNRLEGIAPLPKVATQKWICRQCSMIYDPELGDPDSGIVPGTAFEDIPDDWSCPICGATKKTFMPYQEVVTA